jgi:hypothetical protein
MARAEALRLGPFVGGLNLASDPTAVADSELVACTNFELDIDGSLVSRPPIKETVNMSGTWTGRIVIIGRGSFSGGDYLIGSNGNGTYAFDGTNWTTIQANLKSSVAVQYGGYVWIVPQPGTSGTQKGGRWDPSGGFVADTNMPEGEAAVFHKSRMFIVPGPSASTNESRLRFTDPISSSTLSWTGTNIIDVNPGDGQNLNDLIIFNDNLMLFKHDSTYILAYDINPTDAILRSVNSNIGATTRRCVVSYENSVFTYHEGNVYEIINYDFSRINYKVPFELDVTAPSFRSEDVFLCLLGDRLVVRYYNKVYVYGLKTRTWSEWSSTNEVLHNFGPLLPFPSDNTAALATRYYCGSSILAHENVMYIPNGHDSTTDESTLTTDYDIECYIKTKNYDMADSHHFKRLMWWGADVLTTRDITGRANPIIQSFQTTWSQLASLTWSAISSNTWATPSTTPIGTETNITNTSTVSRLFSKFLKSLRFRQINFELTLLNNGTTVQGPCRLFTLTAIVGSKQTVSKQVN